MTAYFVADAVLEHCESMGISTVSKDDIHKAVFLAAGLWVSGADPAITGDWVGPLDARTILFNEAFEKSKPARIFVLPSLERRYSLCRGEVRTMYRATNPKNALSRDLYALVGTAVDLVFKDEFSPSVKAIADLADTANEAWHHPRADGDHVTATLDDDLMLHMFQERLESVRSAALRL